MSILHDWKHYYYYYAATRVFWELFICFCNSIPTPFIKVTRFYKLFSLVLQIVNIEKDVTIAIYYFITQYMHCMSKAAINLSEYKLRQLNN